MEAALTIDINAAVDYYITRAIKNDVFFNVKVEGADEIGTGEN